MGMMASQMTNLTKLRVTGLCVGNSPVTGDFPAQMASNAENVSIWWRHHLPVAEISVWRVKMIFAKRWNIKSS